MAYATVTLTGTYHFPDGSPAVGTIEIIPSERMILDDDGNVVISGRAKVRLDEQGSFSIALPATDDPALTPTDFGYTVAARLHHTHLAAVSFQLPAAVPTVDITDVTQVDPSEFVPDANYATDADLSELDTRVTTLETTPGGVTSYLELTDTPTIPATAADVGALPDTTTAADLGAVTYGPGLSDAASPLFIAHRGAGARQYPEYALEGMRAAVAAGLQAIELDTYVLADGSIAIHHDATLDRVTTSTGNVTDQTAISFQNVKIDGDLIGGAFAGKAYDHPLFEDVLREFGNKVILVPEIRAGSAAIIKAALEKYNISREHVLVQAFSLTELTPFVADGYHTMKLGDNPDVAALAAAGVEWAGIPSNSTFDPATITAAGLKPFVYLVDRHSDREAWEAKGVVGFFSDDPVYASGRHTVRLTDPYASQTWYHGDHISSSKRGQFTAPDRWGFAADAAHGYYGVLQGWASPIDTPEYMGVRFSFTWDSANLDTSYISAFLGTSDVQFKNAAQAGSNGYHFLIRRNGTFVIYRADNGAFTNLGAGSSAAIPNGMTTTWRITRTLTGAWSLQREDVAASLTRTDTTYEACPYLFLGEGGVAGHFHDVDTNAI